jgi:GT2 family glycosyltransferase
MINIAVLLTVFNRKEKTLSCLTNLFMQQLNDDVVLKVYLTDDNSSDGTADAVRFAFPQVRILEGNGALYWAGGMRNSWNQALADNADYYLLLNDDTVLNAGAITDLLAYYKRSNDYIPAVVIGSTYDDINKNTSYGGHKLISRRRAQYENVFSASQYLECDMGNANIMLVPAAIVKKIGILSTAYTHSIADFDYTLRVKKAGFKNIIVPGYLGICTDDHGKNWKSAGVSLSDRIKYLKSPLGLGYTEYLHFVKTHFPYHLPVAVTKLWLKTLFPVVWDTFKK